MAPATNNIASFNPRFDVEAQEPTPSEEPVTTVDVDKVTTSVIQDTQRSKMEQQSKKKKYVGMAASSVACLAFLIVMFVVGSQWKAASPASTPSPTNEFGTVAPTTATAAPTAATAAPTPATAAPTNAKGTAAPTATAAPTDVAGPPTPGAPSAFDDKIAALSSFAEDKIPDLFFPVGETFKIKHGDNEEKQVVTIEGALAAGTSCDGNPYQYVWARDQAAVNTGILDLYMDAADKESESAKTNLAHLVKYLKFSQQAMNSRGQAYKIADAKVHVDASPYPDNAWCNNQKDGPAARGVVLLNLLKHVPADKLGSENVQLAQELIEDAYNFLTGSDGAVATAPALQSGPNWSSIGCEPWEEARGLSLYPLLNIRRFFIKYHEYTTDSTKKTKLQNLTKDVNAKIGEFWLPGSNTFRTTLQSNKDFRDDDVQTILASLHTYPEEDNNLAEGRLLFEPHHDRPMANAFTTINAFNNYEKFIVNRYDPSHPDLAPAIGRYTEDTYNSNCWGENNAVEAGPWFLATSAIAEFLFKAARGFVEQGFILVSAENQSLLKYVGAGNLATVGETYGADTEAFKQIVMKLAIWGDRFMKRVAHHAGQSIVNKGGETPYSPYHQHEQIHPVTGQMMGAQDLGWSYGATLSANKARNTLGPAAIFAEYTPADGVYAEVVGVVTDGQAKVYVQLESDAEACSDEKVELIENRKVMNVLSERTGTIKLPKSSDVTLQLVTCEGSKKVLGEATVKTETHNMREAVYFTGCGDSCTSFTVEFKVDDVTDSETLALVLDGTMYGYPGFNTCHNTVILNKVGDVFTGTVFANPSTVDGTGKLVKYTKYTESSNTRGCDNPTWQELIDESKDYVTKDGSGNINLLFSSATITNGVFSTGEDMMVFQQQA